MIEIHNLSKVYRTADVETMEGAAVAFVCRRFERPLLHVRAISNWTEAALSNLEAAAFAQDDVGCRYAHIFKQHLHVAMGRIVVAHHVERTYYANARSIGGNDDHALL